MLCPSACRCSKRKRTNVIFFKKNVKYLVLFFQKNHPTTLLHAIKSKHITEVRLHCHGNNKKNSSAIVACSNPETTSGSKLKRTGTWAQALVWDHLHYRVGSADYPSLTNRISTAEGLAQVSERYSIST